VIKSRRIRGEQHVARMGEMRMRKKILVGKLGGKVNIGDLGVDGMLILKEILK
jgi:hypothetical protein